MNVVLWTWILNKAWKIYVNVLQKNEFDGSSVEFENDDRLKR